MIDLNTINQLHFSMNDSLEPLYPHRLSSNNIEWIALLDCFIHEYTQLYKNRFTQFKYIKDNLSTMIHYLNQAYYMSFTIEEVEMIKYYLHYLEQYIPFLDDKGYMREYEFENEEDIESQDIYGLERQLIHKSLLDIIQKVVHYSK